MIWILGFYLIPMVIVLAYCLLDERYRGNDNAKMVPVSAMPVANIILAGTIIVAEIMDLTVSIYNYFRRPK